MPVGVLLMPRPRSDVRAIHAAADRLEPGLARAVERAMEKLRDSVSINALALALSARDVRRAMALLPEAAVKEALSPAGTIIREAVIRGGRLGAEQVNKAARA